MVHTLGGLGQPEITRGSFIPTLWVSHRSFVGMGGETRYIAKVDDDAFVHVADLLALTRRLGAAVPGRMQYVGMLTWSS